MPQPEKSSGGVNGDKPNTAPVDNQNLFAPRPSSREIDHQNKATIAGWIFVVFSGVVFVVLFIGEGMNMVETTFMASFLALIFGFLFHILVRFALLLTNNPGGENTGSHNVAAEDKKNTYAPRPWIRFWARSVDYAACSVLVYFPIGFAHVYGTISNNTFLWLINPFISSILLVFAWALVEPIVMAVFGTTIGKGLLKIKLIHQSNENISNTGLGILYQRSIAVWTKGIGIGLPFVWWITALVGYRNLKSHGETSWDRNGGFTVSHGHVGYIRGGLTTLIMLSVMILGAASNEYLKHATGSDSHLPTTTSADDFLSAYEPGGASLKSRNGRQDTIPRGEQGYGIINLAPNPQSGQQAINQSTPIAARDNLISRAVTGRMNSDARSNADLAANGMGNIVKETDKNGKIYYSNIGVNNPYMNKEAQERHSDYQAQEAARAAPLSLEQELSLGMQSTNPEVRLKAIEAAARLAAQRELTETRR